MIFSTVIAAPHFRKKHSHNRTNRKKLPRGTVRSTGLSYNTEIPKVGGTYVPPGSATLPKAKCPSRSQTAALPTTSATPPASGGNPLPLPIIPEATGAGSPLPTRTTTILATDESILPSGSSPSSSGKPRCPARRSGETRSSLPIGSPPKASLPTGGALPPPSGSYPSNLPALPPIDGQAGPTGDVPRSVPTGGPGASRSLPSGGTNGARSNSSTRSIPTVAPNPDDADVPSPVNKNSSPKPSASPKDYPNLPGSTTTGTRSSSSLPTGLPRTPTTTSQAVSPLPTGLPDNGPNRPPLAGRVPSPTTGKPPKYTVHAAVIGAAPGGYDSVLPIDSPDSPSNTISGAGSTGSPGSVNAAKTSGGLSFGVGMVLALIL